MKHTTIHYTSDIDDTPIPEDAVVCAALFHDREMDAAGSTEDAYTRLHLSPKQASELIRQLAKMLSHAQQEAALTRAFREAWREKGERS